MNIKKTFMVILFSLIILILIFAGYLFIGSTKPAENIIWGVNFSQKQAKLLGLNWQETYSALLEDLGVKNIKLAAHWDLIERVEGEYDFKDLDWQVAQAKEKDVRLLLVIGMKTPRWPECHLPEWAKSLSKKEQQEKILALLEKTVLHFRDSEASWAWQVENEPFFPFGECPWTDKDFLKKEINLVKSLDSRPVIISESGELPLWITAARFGDMVGVTMYKKTWVRQIGIYFTYPFPPVFYHRKAEIVRKIFGKEIIGVELQAEPWGPASLVDLPMEEQQKTMSLERFKYNVDFAKKTGLDTHYLWGAEWWYWLKEKQEKPEIWDEAKKLFQ